MKYGWLALIIGAACHADPHAASGRAAPKTAPEPERLAALSARLASTAQAALPDDQDAAAVMRLDDGRLLLTHHDTILRKRRMMPGSVMKLVAAYTLARSNADPTYTCRGHHRDPQGTERPCWYRPGHGTLRLRAAVAHSCNVWFYAQAPRVAPADWRQAATAFGLGAPWLEPGVARDLVPSHPQPADWPDIIVGDHLSLRVTPFSLLRLVSVVATAGTRVEPSRTGGHPPTSTPLDSDALRLVAEGMIEAVESGTLRGVFDGLPVAAKTGTAKKHRAVGTRGWVVGFLPVDRPQYAFVVLKGRGRGATDAGPAAGALARALLGSEPQAETP